MRLPAPLPRRRRRAARSLRPRRRHRPPGNGRTVPADDVKYSYERLLADKASLYSGDHAFLDKIEAVDAKTLRFTAKYPYSPRYETGAAMIVAREAVEAFGDLNRKGIG